MTIFTQTDPVVYDEVVKEFREQQPLYVVQDTTLACLDEKGEPLTKSYRLEWEVPRFKIFRRPD